MDARALDKLERQVTQLLETGAPAEDWLKLGVTPDQLEAMAGQFQGKAGSIPFSRGEERYQAKQLAQRLSRLAARMRQGSSPWLDPRIKAANRRALEGALPPNASPLLIALRRGKARF